MTAPAGLAATSLRRRVTIATVAVFVAGLIAASAAVYASFSVFTKRSTATILASEVQTADKLASANTPPAQLVDRLESRSVSVHLQLADGRSFGRLPAQAAPDPDIDRRHIRLPNTSGVLQGARLTLQVDGRPLAAARHRLAKVLAVVVLVALVAIAIVVPVVVRYALSPLDTMTALARAISGGRRGQRFAPPNQNTELGRTAAAFDEMLDALEGAERRALASEERMRRFVADAAHELRTPVTGIGAAAEAVLQQPIDADPAERERLLLVLGGEARRAGRLIDDLLDLARIDSGLSLHPQPTDLRALADAQADRARLTHPGVDVEVTGPRVQADVDAARIGQVLANLLNNACDVTPAGATVHVTVLSSAREVSVIVHDDGPGIAEEDRERIFGRLVRLSAAGRSGGGSGLGLPIARGIARAHGGDVVCIAPPAGRTGAVFVLRLPLDQAAAG